MLYWERERGKRKGFGNKLLSGLPMAMLFSLPIVLLVIVVYFVSPEWYTKIADTSSGTFITVIIAVFLCIIFFSYFRMHYKWEMNEQLYRELLKKFNSTG